ncbi:MAG: hypothetical protein M9962_02830 [Oligoflexia bacterium]|nr:hypothetical protein [Oligoflexia bacterium]
MKTLLCLFMLILTPFAQAHEGSWFAVGPSYENITSGNSEGGWSVNAEGGYWYLGNVAYGGHFKAAFFGDVNGNAASGLKIYDMGVFWKAASEAGFYGKLLAGLAFVNHDGTNTGFRMGDGKSFYIGLGGGFLFPLTETLNIGPEVIYRHLTARNGGDQISIGMLVSFSL